MKKLVLLIFAMSLVGCAAPTVKLKNALLQKLTTKDLEVGLNFDVTNPNEYQIPISGIDWDLDLFKADFTDGKTAFSRNIPAQRTAGVEIPIGINFKSVAVGVTNLLTKKSIPWGVGGGMSFKVPTQEALRIGYNADGSWSNPLLDGTFTK